MVIPDNLLELKSEWRTIATNESEIKARTRLQSSLASHVMGLFTVIRKENIDASRKKIEPSVLQCNYDSITRMNSSCTFQT